MSCGDLASRSVRCSSDCLRLRTWPLMRVVDFSFFRFFFFFSEERLIELIFFLVVRPKWLPACAAVVGAYKCVRMSCGSEE